MDEWLQIKKSGKDTKGAVGDHIEGIVKGCLKVRCCFLSSLNSNKNRPLESLAEVRSVAVPLAAPKKHKHRKAINQSINQSIKNVPRK